MAVTGRECAQVRAWLGLSRRSLARLLGKSEQSLYQCTESSGCRRGLLLDVYEQLLSLRAQGVSPREALGVDPTEIDQSDRRQVLAHILNHQII